MKPLQRWQNWHTHLPDWLQEWLDVMVPLLQIVLIVFCAWLLHRLVRRVLSRASTHYQLPHELLMPINVVVRWLIVSGAVLLALERLGVSATVLWSAFTGFATVGAVAFFAAWSVLSNFFCALLIFTVRPYRLGDYIEVLDALDKPGAKGRVIDINMLYTTLQDFVADKEHGAVLQSPNAHMFQKVVRRWSGLPPTASAEPTAAPGAAANASAAAAPSPTAP